MASLDARIWAGVCEGRGIDQMDKRTDGGLRPPWSLEDRPDLVEAAGDCADTKAFRYGEGVGHARFVGCGVVPEGPERAARHAMGCTLFR